MVSNENLGISNENPVVFDEKIGVSDKYIFMGVSIERGSLVVLQR